MQAVYISGLSIKPAFEQYLKAGIIDENGKRRPDFRSSAQKRLMPQLALKVPIFRRWGKRFFVATDNTFFDELPGMPPQSSGNSEITWLTYGFQKQKHGGYKMQNMQTIHTLWDDVENALREGKAPEQSEILRQLSFSARKLRKYVS